MTNKVGTLTFHNCDNYGAVLQAYALQKVLLDMGMDTEIINYSRNNLVDVSQMFKTKTLTTLKGNPDKQLYSVKEFFEMVFHGDGNSYDIHESFVKFRQKNFICSRPVNKKTIRKLENKYDYIIVGSDQVWNCGRVNLDTTYLLDFVSNDDKKISYAASFGINTVPKKYINTYKFLLSKFSRISVREEQGVNLVKKLTGKKAECVLDPTLLLDKNEWIKIADRNIGKHEHYILVYNLGESNRIMEIANKLSKQTGFKVRYVRKQKSKTDSRVVKGVSPEKWIGLFYNADYIITNSFHGVVFSINFNKNFYAVKAEDRIRKAMQSRLENILNKVKLTNRYISSYSEIDLKETIPYKKVNSNINILREQSIAYLKEALRENGKTY